ncbi:hypothetical protein AWJ20_4501 [Sugiyamaella lignohabitans]|uniref:Uncharacterized protein n=1 Tax=Sugiyamaella lignohabitans TaxID=796027 RepID=A0A167CGY3_9ASCO|nr:uncharacterized protein AWJ20_4501 [Sugiyamaella lignohabitans]ANB11680.1 hypothetical protein AWJ20_4501 [Sugiyamaella lignohabitans]
MSYYYTPSPPSASGSLSYGNDSMSVNHTRVPSYNTTAAGSVASYSRPNSVSPQFTNAFPVSGSFFGAQPVHHNRSCKQRFNASRGFEMEDDMEFCPALTSDRSSASSSVSSDSSDYHQDYTISRPANLGSPISSPAKTNAVLSAASVSPSTPAISRVRKAIEIVDPTTGLRVSSPPTPSAGLRR